MGTEYTSGLASKSTVKFVASCGLTKVDRVASLNITLSDESLSLLEDKAEKLGVSLEELAMLGVVELLSRTDFDFEKAVEYVLGKNDELYKRLA